MLDGCPGISPSPVHGEPSDDPGRENKEAREDNIPKLARLPPWLKVSACISFVPARCRYDPNQPFEFSIGLNLLFGIYIQITLLKLMQLTFSFPFLAFAACFTVANLYYNHPILNLLAHDFGVTEYQSSYIPTLAQAGYAGGLLFLCPLGDLLKRRAFVLWLVWFTATAWYVDHPAHNLYPSMLVDHSYFTL
jgi:hypothetical protein